MAKKLAPTKLTGGGGFDFEDRVTARFLLDMLAGLPSFGVEHGQIVQVDRQVRDAGWLLDDLAVTLRSPAGTRTAALSVKSDRQITEAGFPEDFVEAAWEQRLHITSDAFGEGRDLLVMATGKIANQVMTSWETLLREAMATTPERMLARLQPPHDPGQGSQSSVTERALFVSLRCPERLRSLPDTDDAATVRLVRHLLVLHFDFEDEPSRDETEAIVGCQRVLRSGDSDDAGRLWDRLRGIAAEQRGRGGSVSLPRLIGLLRGEFDLRDYPDHEADWEAVGRLSAEVMEDVSTDIAGVVSLLRTSILNAAEDALDQSGVCMLVGESGSGKSAVGKIVAMRRYERVIWSPAGALESGRPGSFDLELGLRHPLLDLLRSAGNRCLLVFDGAEKESDAAVRLIGRIVVEIRADVDCQHVHLLLLTQVEAASRVSDELRRAGVEANALHLLTVGNALDRQIGTVVSVVPDLSWATVQKDLWPVLCNLKVLDLVARMGLRGARMEGSPCIGLPALIDSIWEGWIQRGADGVARSGVLQRIGILEGEGLVVGVPVVKLEHAQQAALPALESDGLVRVRHERASFRHDLLGDWLRLRVLVGEEPVGVADLRERAGLPRWHPAIRLFARRMLVQPNGVNRWRQVVEEAGDGSVGGTLLRDLFVEAVVLAENAGRLLELVWLVLIADNARLLASLLDRFLYVATVPDPRVRRLPGTETVSPQIEATFRIPYWPYWGPVIATLRRHSDYIVRLAPLLATRICRLWLEHTPWETEDGKPFPWRREAAELAVAIAREVQTQVAEGIYLPDDLERSAYETALLAAADMPDEVAALMLELAQRRDVLPAIRARAQEARRKAKAADLARLKDNPALAQHRNRFPQLSRFEGPLQEPWPDGPRSRVAEQFQAACLGGQCLLPLVVRRPDVALEVLLAVCIEEPRPSDLFGGDEMLRHYGVDDWPGGYPPMYFRGPFLAFLRQSPEQGLSFVVRLVNFATKRWAKSERVHAAQRSGQTRLTEEDLGIHVRIGDSDRLWLGDGHVLRWHLDLPLDSKVISCALMALEKWLCDEMDAKRDVSHWIRRILAESESVAFAGLLLDLGKRHPDLFLTDLRDLLSGWHLYHWDQGVVMERSGMNVGLIAWARESGELARLAREWFTAPHRARLLAQIAVLLLQNEDMQPFFASLRERWSKMLDPEDRPSNLKRLVERLNPPNYHLEKGADGNEYLVFEWPEELRERTEQEAAAAGQQVQFLSFPFRCRGILDGKAELAAAELGGFWMELTWIAALSPEDYADDPVFASRQRDAVCGGAAILVCRHREWLLANPERERWCLAQLVGAVENHLARDLFDVPNSAGEHHWDVFVGEAGVGLLAEDRNDETARRLVATGVMGFHYSATRQTVQCAFRSRHLGVPFEQVHGLVLAWAAVRRRVARSEQLEIDAGRWQGRKSRLFEAFVQDRLPSFSRQLERLNRWGAKALDRIHRKRYSADGLGMPPAHDSRQPAPRQLPREAPSVDVSVLTAAFAWLDLLDLGLAADRNLLLAAARDLLKLILQGLPQVTEGSDAEIERPQYECDHWVLGQVARAIAVADRPEDRMSLWQPILEMGKPGHGWIQYFFWEWFTEGVKAAQSPECFVSRWREMIEYALRHLRWNPGGAGWYNLRDMVREMLGFHFGMSTVADDERYAIAVGGMREVFATAAAKWFDAGDIADGFALFVVCPAAGRLLKPSICWLHDACKKFTDYHDWEVRDVEEHLVAALTACWERHAADVATDEDLRTAFLGLANLLSARGCHAALVLRDRVLASLPGR